MARTGRPKKAEGGLTTDIKVRVNDETAKALDEACNFINSKFTSSKCTRADLIRASIDELLSAPAHNYDKEGSVWYAIQNAERDLGIARVRVESAEVLLRGALGNANYSHDDMKKEFNECLPELIETFRHFITDEATLHHYLLEKKQEFSELKNDPPASSAKKSPQK